MDIEAYLKSEQVREDVRNVLGQHDRVWIPQERALCWQRETEGAWKKVTLSNGQICHLEPVCYYCPEGEHFIVST